MQDQLSEYLEYSESVEYPDHWPDLPEGFEITERSRFRKGEIEIIAEHEQYMIRVSTHIKDEDKDSYEPDLWSATIMMDGKTRDYYIQHFSTFELWMSMVLYRLPQYRSLCIPTKARKENHPDIIGINDEGMIKVTGNPSPSIEITPAQELYLGDCTNMPVHDPQNLGELRFIYTTTKKSKAPVEHQPQFYYVFENALIEIKTIHENQIKNRVQAIPDPIVAIKVLQSENVREEYKLIYINEDWKDRYELIASLM